VLLFFTTFYQKNKITHGKLSTLHLKEDAMEYTVY